MFDRSWYGRVLVERVEGYCREPDWMRAYDEINQFEEQLDASRRRSSCKFWLQISKAEQLRRFRAREKTPFKRFKITPEDWRNRKKWGDYEQRGRRHGRPHAAPNSRRGRWSKRRTSTSRASRSCKTIVERWSARSTEVAARDRRTADCADVPTRAARGCPAGTRRRSTRPAAPAGGARSGASASRRPTATSGTSTGWTRRAAAPRPTRRSSCCSTASKAAPRRTTRAR